MIQTSIKPGNQEPDLYEIQLNIIQNRHKIKLNAECERSEMPNAIWKWVITQKGSPQGRQVGTGHDVHILTKSKENKNAQFLPTPLQGEGDMICKFYYMKWLSVFLGVDSRIMKYPFSSTILI